MDRLSRNGRVFLMLLALTVGGGVTAGAVGAAQKVAKLPEPQSISDVQLVEALHVLKHTKHVLENSNHDYGGHRAAAVHDVKAATHQLHLALEHVHKHHKNTLPPTPKVIKTAKGNSEPQALSDHQLAESIKVLEKTVV